MEQFWNSGGYWRLATSRGRLGQKIALILILFNFNSGHNGSNPYLIPQVLQQTVVCEFLEQLVGARMNKDPVFQILWICAMTADCCFWSQGDKSKRLWPFLYHFFLLLQCPPPLPKVTFRGFNRPAPFLSSSFSSPSSLRSWTSNTRPFKGNCINEGDEKVTVHTQGKAQAQKRLEKIPNLHLRLILRTDTAYNN